MKGQRSMGARTLTPLTWASKYSGSLIQRVSEAPSGEGHRSQNPVWRLHGNIGTILDGGHRHIDQGPHVCGATNFPSAREPVQCLEMFLKTEGGLVHIHEPHRRVRRVAKSMDGAARHH